LKGERGAPGEVGPPGNLDESIGKSNLSFDKYLKLIKTDSYFKSWILTIAL